MSGAKPARQPTAVLLQLNAVCPVQGQHLQQCELCSRPSHLLLGAAAEPQVSTPPCPWSCPGLSLAPAPPPASRATPPQVPPVCLPARLPACLPACPPARPPACRCPGCPGASKGSVVTAWAAEMTSYLKCLDPNHLVAVAQPGWCVWCTVCLAGWPCNCLAGRWSAGVCLAAAAAAPTSASPNRPPDQPPACLPAYLPGHPAPSSFLQVWRLQPRGAGNRQPLPGHRV